MMKRTREGSDEPVEVHDSGFLSPMVMFPTFPHNDTFIDTRKLKVIASPNSTTAEEYTFTHHPNDYGVMNLSEAKIKASISLKAADGQDLANDL